MKCAHPGCKCDVPVNGTFGSYCSEHCQKTGDAHEGRCQCNHPQCK